MGDICLRIERGDIQMERQQAIEVTIPISSRQPRLMARDQALCDIAVDRAQKSSVR